MLFKILFTIPLYLLLSSLGAQEISCRLTDAATQPIPYASVHLPDLERGTLTDDSGSFSLSLTGGADSSKVRISCLNFETAVVSIGDLRRMYGTGGCELQLVADVALLETAEVSGERLRLRDRTIGFKKGINNAWFDFIGVKSHPEIGSIMQVRERCRIDKIGVRIREVEVDSFFLEVNLYDYPVRGVVMGKPLLRDRIFATIDRNAAGENFVIDLQDQHLWVEHDFVITYRMLRTTQGEGTIKMAARTGEGKALYTKGDGRWDFSYIIPSVWAEVSYPR